MILLAYSSLASMCYSPYVAMLLGTFWNTQRLNMMPLIMFKLLVRFFDNFYCKSRCLWPCLGWSIQSEISHDSIEDFWTSSAQIIQSFRRMKLEKQTLWYPFWGSSKEILIHYLDQRFLMDKEKEVISAFCRIWETSSAFAHITLIDHSVCSINLMSFIAKESEDSVWMVYSWAAWDCLDYPETCLWPATDFHCFACASGIVLMVARDNGQSRNLKAKGG